MCSLHFVLARTAASLVLSGAQLLLGTTPCRSGAYCSKYTSDQALTLD